MCDATYRYNCSGGELTRAFAGAVGASARSVWRPCDKRCRSGGWTVRFKNKCVSSVSCPVLAAEDLTPSAVVSVCGAVPWSGVACRRRTDSEQNRTLELWRTPRPWIRVELSILSFGLSGQFRAFRRQKHHTRAPRVRSAGPAAHAGSTSRTRSGH